MKLERKQAWAKRIKIVQGSMRGFLYRRYIWWVDLRL